MQTDQQLGEQLHSLQHLHPKINHTPENNNEYFFKKNDRIVFFGDSITEAQLFTNYVEDYMSTRFPDYNLTFYNAGWGGDTAHGGLIRLNRDVLALRPTIVIVCYGMNDAAYSAPSAEILRRFSTDMSLIVRRLKAKRIRAVLLTPGFADVSANPMLKAVDYNRKGLQALADFVVKLARKERIPFFDIHKLMTEVNEKAHKADAKFAMTLDGYHPDPAGHLVMAYGVLKAMGVPPRHEKLAVDIKAGRVHAPANVIVGALRKTAYGYSFDIQLDRLPFFVEPAARKVLPYLPFQETYNDFQIVATGLEDKEYYLRFEKESSQPFSRETLSHGLNFFSLWMTPPMLRAQQVHQYTMEKCQVYFKLWRLLGLSSTSPDYTFGPHSAGINIMPVLDKGRISVATSSLPPSKVRFVSSHREGELVEEGDFISLWNIYGPFPGPFHRDHLGGEAKFGKDLSGMKNKLAKTGISPQNAANCLGEIFGPVTDCLAYALAVLESPADQEGTLLLGTDDGYAAWLNGKLIGNALDIRRGLTPDQEKISVRLKKGPNTLLLKITQGAGTWGFCARFSGCKQPMIVRKLG